MFAWAKGRTVGLYTQTEADPHLHPYNGNDARPRPTKGQVHLVEIVDSLSPRRGKLLTEE